MIADKSNTNQFFPYTLSYAHPKNMLAGQFFEDMFKNFGPCMTDFDYVNSPLNSFSTKEYDESLTWKWIGIHNDRKKYLILMKNESDFVLAKLLFS